MDPATILSDQPASVQLFIYALAGLGIAGWMVVRYFKEKAGAQAESARPGAPGGLILSGDGEACKGLITALERAASTGERLDHTNRRLEDAVRDLREEVGKFRGAVIAMQFQPRDEEMNRLVKLLLEERERGRPAG